MLHFSRTALAGAALLALAAPVTAQTWQQPKEFQKPRDTWQQPGEIQVPKGIQAIRAEDERCTKRFLVGADALFEFDKATLTPDAEETLEVLVPMLTKAGKHPATVEGHTDSKGADDYNQTLSEKRARTVKDWLVAHGALAATAPVQGWGERRPVAPNAKPDGSDDPAGRQKNRRVAVILDLCAGKG
ncbi:MAG TPA: OmpA family protein [Thermoanaerobaculia bacterium]|nr:OmpA family protein [Thermoanaerobaculia bacterium]